jgi:hypothetical protein
MTLTVHVEQIRTGLLRVQCCHVLLTVEAVRGRWQVSDENGPITIMTDGAEALDHAMRTAQGRCLC